MTDAASALSGFGPASLLAGSGAPSTQQSFAGHRVVEDFAPAPRRSLPPSTERQSDAGTDRGTIASASASMSPLSMQLPRPRPQDTASLATDDTKDRLTPRSGGVAGRRGSVFGTPRAGGTPVFGAPAASSAASLSQSQTALQSGSGFGSGLGSSQTVSAPPTGSLNQTTRSAMFGAKTPKTYDWAPPGVNPHMVFLPDKVFARLPFEEGSSTARSAGEATLSAMGHASDAPVAVPVPPRFKDVNDASTRRFDPTVQRVPLKDGPIVFSSLDTVSHSLAAGGEEALALKRQSTAAKTPVSAGPGSVFGGGRGKASTEAPAHRLGPRSIARDVPKRMPFIPRPVQPMAAEPVWEPPRPRVEKAMPISTADIVAEPPPPRQRYAEEASAAEQAAAVFRQAAEVLDDQQKAQEAQEAERRKQREARRSERAQGGSIFGPQVPSPGGSRSGSPAPVRPGSTEEGPGASETSHRGGSQADHLSPQARPKRVQPVIAYDDGDPFLFRSTQLAPPPNWPQRLFSGPAHLQSEPSKNEESMVPTTSFAGRPTSPLANAATAALFGQAAAQGMDAGARRPTARPASMARQASFLGAPMMGRQPSFIGGPSNASFAMGGASGVSLTSNSAPPPPRFSDGAAALERIEFELSPVVLYVDHNRRFAFAINTHNVNDGWAAVELTGFGPEPGAPLLPVGEDWLLSPGTERWFVLRVPPPPTAADRVHAMTEDVDDPHRVGTPWSSVTGFPASTAGGEEEQVSYVDSYGDLRMIPGRWQSRRVHELTPLHCTWAHTIPPDTQLPACATPPITVDGAVTTRGPQGSPQGHERQSGRHHGKGAPPATDTKSKAAGLSDRLDKTRYLVYARSAAEHAIVAFHCGRRDGDGVPLFIGKNLRTTPPDERLVALPKCPGWALLKERAYTWVYRFEARAFSFIPYDRLDDPCVMHPLRLKDTLFFFAQMRARKGAVGCIAQLPLKPESPDDAADADTTTPTKGSGLPGYDYKYATPVSKADHLLRNAPQFRSAETAAGRVGGLAAFDQYDDAALDGVMEQRLLPAPKTDVTILRTPDEIAFMAPAREAGCFVLVTSDLVTATVVELDRWARVRKFIADGDA